MPRRADRSPTAWSRRLPDVTDLGEFDDVWAGTTLDWVEVDGHRVRLLRRPAAGSSAATFLCVHGLGGASTNWAEAAAPLSRLGHVVAPDLPGFGETPPEDHRAPTPEHQATFLAKLLMELRTGPVVLVGNSMGGMISTLLAARRPDLVSGVVLLGPALPAHVPAYRPTSVQLRNFGPMLVPGLGPRIIRRRLEQMTFEEQYRRSMRELTGDHEAIPERVVHLGTANLARLVDLRWRGRALTAATMGILDLQLGLGQPRMLRAIRTVEAPTLYLRGTEDPLIVSAVTTRLRRMELDRWTLEEPDGLGHVIMLEDPHFLSRRVTDFLAHHELAAA